MGKVIAAGAYAGGRRVATIDIADSGMWAAKREHFVWVGFHDPDAAELRQLQVQFGLHELAIEDALNAQQRPKIEQYGETTFLVLRTAACVEAHIALGETYIFVGRGYVITVRRGSSASYAPVRQRVEAAPEQLAHGEDYVVYAIIDFIVDNYLVAIERLAAEVEAIEEHILDPPLSRRRWRRSTRCGASSSASGWWWRPRPRSAGGSSTRCCPASTRRSSPTTGTSSTT
jgi:magnesium transporter